jgi:hypothetical protein
VGIGKTTIWLAGVEAARERGLRVLVSRPAEAERELAHVVLGDLFEGVLDDVLPALAAPRRHALEFALLAGDAPEQPVDRRAVGVGVRTALQALAEAAPVVLAIDDIQWVDALPPRLAFDGDFVEVRSERRAIVCAIARIACTGQTQRILKEANASGRGATSRLNLRSV